MTRKWFWLTLFSAVLLAPGVGWGADNEVWQATGFENSPGDDDAAASGAAKIRVTREETGDRGSVEHYWGDNDNTDDDNGLQRLGSARCFMSDGAPTVLSDTSADHANTGAAGETGLNDTAFNSDGNYDDDIGHGRCWIDLDGADGVNNEDCTGVGTDDNSGLPDTSGTNACCTAADTGTCGDDDNKLYVYVGVAGDAGTCPVTGECGWQEAVTAAATFNTAADIAADDQLLEGSFNYVYNGSFDFADGTGSAASTTVPAGWAAVTSPTYAYTDPSTDTRWGDGFEVVVTNAGTTNEGITYTLTNLPSDTVFKVIARAKDDGTAVCTLDVTNEGGAAFTSTATTTDVWETLSGTFGTTVGAVDVVEVTLVTTGADTTECTWDHVGVFQAGAVATDRDEIAPPSFGGYYVAYTGTADIEETGTGMADVPDLTASFTPPSDGWVIQVGTVISMGVAWDGAWDAQDGVQCQIELGGTKVSGTLHEITGHLAAGSSNVSLMYTSSALNINPTAGTALVYTVACVEIGAHSSTFNYNSTESHIWLTAAPPH